MKKQVTLRTLYWITNHHTYYHDYLFQHIESDHSFKLIVCYRQMVLDSHPWKEVEGGGYTRTELNRHFWGLDFKVIRKAMLGSDDYIVAGWDNLMYLFLITILRIRNRPFGVFSDTPGKPGRNWLQFLKLRWFSFIFSPNSKAKLLVTGKVGVNRSLSFLRLDSKHVLNFPFATNHDIFIPANNVKFSKRDGVVSFLAVGRIDFDHKGQDIALKAFAKLLERGVTNFKYIIAGTGEDLEQMKALEVKFGLQSFVEHLGWVEIRDLPIVFNKAHFTLHASHEDPFPNAILESLSCGVPVLSSDAAGSGLERIANGVNGFLFSDGNVEELSHLLESAISMSEVEWLHMKTECRRLALEWPVEYNLEVLKDLFLEPS